MEPNREACASATADDDAPGRLDPRGTALLLALCAALLLLRLPALPLVGPDEPRYARVAVEMHRAGSWVRPTLQGAPWLEKPPLYYWLAGAAFALVGESDAAARLPSLAATLLLVGVTALVGARLYGRSAGLHAGFVLATALLVFVYGHAAGMDMLLAATVTAAIGLVALGGSGLAGRLAIPAAYAFAGLAALAKGPLGLLLPALVAGGHAAATRDAALARRLVSLRGLALLALVAGPWYAAILLDQGRAFVDVFLLDHNLQRFTSTIHRHPGPIYFYVPLVVAGLFPWSGLLLPALARVARRQRSRIDAFVLLWFALPFAFFSAAGSKLPGYILPCLPPLALLIGREAAALAAGRLSAGWGRAAALLGLALGSVAAAAGIAAAWSPDPSWRAALPPALWALVTTFAFARQVAGRPEAALPLLRAGAAGLALLTALAAPPLLARRESGRDLFRHAGGREVLVWGAWRTAWMAGYFYNDARVRQVAGMPELLSAAGGRPVLVLCGPAERRQLEAAKAVPMRVIAEGPRRNVLVELGARPGEGDLALTPDRGRGADPPPGRRRPAPTP